MGGNRDLGFWFSNPVFTLQGTFGAGMFPSKVRFLPVTLWGDLSDSFHFLKNKAKGNPPWAVSTPRSPRSPTPSSGRARIRAILQGLGSWVPTPTLEA